MKPDQEDTAACRYDGCCSSSDLLRGHPFMTSTKIRFLTPPPVHMGRTPSPLWTSTHGRYEIHIALLKRLVQLPPGPKAKIRLYDCNLSKTVLLVSYITNLYRQKISTLYSVQRRNSGKKRCRLLCM